MVPESRFLFGESSWVAYTNDGVILAASKRDNVLRAAVCFRSVSFACNISYCVIRVRGLPLILFVDASSAVSACSSALRSALRPSADSRLDADSAFFTSDLRDFLFSFHDASSIAFASVRACRETEQMRAMARREVGEGRGCSETKRWKSHTGARMFLPCMTSYVQVYRMK
jgi:hypothetical protein